MKPNAHDIERLSTLLKSRHPAISIVTHEEREALGVARAAAESIGAHLWCWSLLEGVYDLRKGPKSAVKETTNPAAAFFWLAERDLPAVIVLLDAADHMEDPHARRSLRALIERADGAGSHVVMIDHADAMPASVRAHATSFDISLPDDEAIDDLVRSTLRELNKINAIDLDVSRKDYAVMIKNLRGLTSREIVQIVRDVVAIDRRLDAEDLNEMMARKRQLLSEGGALEYVESPASLDEIGGLVHLKSWLNDRANSFDEQAEAYGLNPPRGVLMLGVQGAGKSLCSKAIATAWGRPLLRLDPGSLYDRYVGESERRLRDALKQAEMMAPVVLWIDEIEKGFASAASQSTDGGLSQRMFGALLTWMQDHEAPVFTVATANNIEALPPELLRKGRFDEIFFVDLPAEPARRMIFEIHLRKRDRDPKKFDLEALAAAAEGFSGAEIEQAVISAMHAAFNAKSEPTTESILNELEQTNPLSVTMAERIDRLRAWASERCVPAG